MNGDLIDTKFNEIKNSLSGWKLIKPGLFIAKKSKPKDAHSCASLALYLLKKGGIDRLLSGSDKSKFGSQFSSFVAPDSLVPYVKRAKQMELERYQEIATNVEFKLEGETQVAAVIDNKKCMIM